MAACVITEKVEGAAVAELKKKNVDDNFLVLHKNTAKLVNRF